MSIKGIDYDKAAVPVETTFPSGGSFDAAGVAGTWPTRPCAIFTAGGEEPEPPINNGSGYTFDQFQCTPYESIRFDENAELLPIGRPYDQFGKFVIVSLPRPFPILGDLIESLVVTEAMSLNLLNDTIVGATNTPISTNDTGNDPYELIPRISVAQNGDIFLEPDSTYWLNPKPQAFFLDQVCFLDLKPLHFHTS